jgi:glycosyltransferase involved in cell wall biosynthesis
MPCLNEADTLALCINKAQQALRESGVAGEIIVADNGSADGSQKIAGGLGARVVDVDVKGYGSALMGGIAAARGRYVVMGDADDSYDFREIPGFLAKLREGYDLVQGCRLPAGGGRVMPGAMPFLHRWWGNPMFSWLARGWFRAPVQDVYCGLRGFSRAHYEQLGQRCTGMEFATEMIIKTSLLGARIGEVPITLHVDGRKAHAPHLRTFRDGWRTLRFFMLYSPRWLFLVPGALLILLGIAGYGIALPRAHIGRVVFDVHTLLFASLGIIGGYQSVFFALFTKVFAIS